MDEFLLESLKRRLGPLFNADDGASGAAAPEPTDNTDGAGATGDASQADKDTATTTEPTDNADDGYRPLDREAARKQLEEEERRARDAKFQADIDEIRKQRTDTPAPTSPKINVRNPYENITQEQLDDDPDLARAYFDYMDRKALATQIAESASNSKALRDELEQSKRTREELGRKQEAATAAEQLVTRATARHPLFNKSNDPAHQHRMQKLNSDIKSLASDLASRGYSRRQIELHIESTWLPDYIEEVERYIGMPQNTNQPPATESIRDAADRRDAIARNNISGGGAMPPSRSTDEVVPDRAVDIVSFIERKMQAAR